MPRLPHLPTAPNTPVMNCVSSQMRLMMQLPIRRWAVVKAAMCLVLLGMPASVVAQSTESIEYFHTDAIGSVRMVTGPTGEVLERRDFLPFGEELALPPNAQPLGFGGAERDAETANGSSLPLNYFGARHLQAASGSFTTVDPGHVGFYSGDPQTWNAYAYANNNPLRWVDPDGTQARLPRYEETVEVRGNLTDAMLRAIQDAHAIRIEIPLEWPTLLTSTAETIKSVAQPIAEWVTAPRDPKCMIGATAAVSGVGAVVGAGLGGFGGLVTGVTAGAGPGSVPLGIAFSAGGAKAGGLMGAGAGALMGGGAGYLGCPLAMAKVPSRGVGGSGEVRRHFPRYNTRKAAQDAARQRGKGKPAEHRNPSVGDPHFHPIDKTGKIIKDGVHHVFPR